MTKNSQTEFRVKNLNNEFINTRLSTKLSGAKHGKITKIWLPIVIFIIKTTIDINTDVKGWRCWWIGVQTLKPMLKPKRLCRVVDA